MDVFFIFVRFMAFFNIKKKTNFKLLKLIDRNIIRTVILFLNLSNLPIMSILTYTLNFFW